MSEPLRQYGKSTFRETSRLDVEFFVRFEMVGEFPQELVSHDLTIVVREAVLPGLVHLEVIEPPDSELAILGDLPVERPEAVGLAEFADRLRIRCDCAGRCRRSSQCRHVWISRGSPRTSSGGDKTGSVAPCVRD